MTQKNSDARKAYWASITPEERSARLKKVAQTKQKNMTFKQRRTHALLMVAGRKARAKTKASKFVL